MSLQKTEVRAVPSLTESQPMTDDDPRPTAALEEAMKRFKREVGARRDAVPDSEAYEKALAAEARTDRQVMDLARRAGAKGRGTDR
jgi:ribosomal protein S21